METVVGSQAGILPPVGSQAGMLPQLASRAAVLPLAGSLAFSLCCIGLWLSVSAASLQCACCSDKLPGVCRTCPLDAVPLLAGKMLPWISLVPAMPALAPVKSGFNTLVLPSVKISWNERAGWWAQWWR